MISMPLRDLRCEHLEKLAIDYAFVFFTGGMISPLLMIELESKNNIEKKKYFYNVFSATLSDLAKH